MGNALSNEKGSNMLGNRVCRTAIRILRECGAGKWKAISDLSAVTGTSLFLAAIFML